MHSSPRLLVLSTAVAFGAFASAAAAAGPVLMSGNPSCADLDPAFTEVKLDTGAAGTHAVTGGTITIDAGGMTASFSVTQGIDAVIVKAGDQANVYTYDPDVMSASGLDGGGSAQISHISLCSGPDAPGGDPDPDPDPDPSPDPDPDPSPSPSPGTGTGPSPQAQVLGETFTGGPSVKPAVVVAGRSAIHGPSSCVKKAFTVRITGRRIATVAFRIDGRVVKSSGRKLRVAPSRYGTGVHRIAARVRYTAASETKARTHRFVFQRCAQQAVAPRFAG